MFGENPNPDEMHYIKWTLYFISTIVISVVALNLLIAVISNTYGQVQDAIDAVHCKQKAMMLNELAVFQGNFEEGEGDLKYLYIFKYANEDKHGASTDEQGGIVKAMDTRIKTMMTKIADSKDHLAEKLKSQKDAIKKEVAVEITGCKDKIDATNKTVDDLKSLIAAVKEDQKNVKTTVAAVKALAQRLHSKLA